MKRRNIQESRYMFIHHTSGMTSGFKLVRVYCGEGSSPNSVNMLYNALSTSLKETIYSVHLITPNEIKEGQWQSSTVLLAFGGGYDLGYIRALGTPGIDMIREYVHDGGSYLGICAGGYFGCNEIEFDKGGPQEVCGKGRLGFFPGKCVGPLFQNYVYNSEAGAHASVIHPCFPEANNRNTLKNFYCYFNGGGKFIPYQSKTRAECSDSMEPALCEGTMDATQRVKKLGNLCPDPQQSAAEGRTDYGQYEVISTYSELASAPSAVVKCPYGNGKAILMGVHLEYDPSQMDKKNPYLHGIIPKLLETNKTRLNFCTSVLKNLGLQILH